MTWFCFCKPNYNNLNPFAVNERPTVNEGEVTPIVIQRDGGYFLGYQPVVVRKVKSPCGNFFRWEKDVSKDRPVWWLKSYSPNEYAIVTKHFSLDSVEEL